MANLITDGRTITHSALSSSSCGILSGTFRISVTTVVAFRMRFFSFSCAETDRAIPPIIISVKSDFIGFLPTVLTDDARRQDSLPWRSLQASLSLPHNRRRVLRLTQFAFQPRNENVCCD